MSLYNSVTSCTFIPFFLQMLAIFLVVTDSVEAVELTIYDVTVGPRSNVTHNPVISNGAVFFAADREKNPVPVKPDLWKANPGDEIATRLTTNGCGPYDLTDVDGTLFFGCSNKDTPGADLWKSDGKVSGTVLVKEFPAPGGPLGLTNVAGTLFFTATNPGKSSGRELWKSDGKPGGTVEVKDITPGPGSTDFGSYPDYPNFVAVGNTLFFVADDGSNGRELWKSDAKGTTVKVKPGASLSIPFSSKYVTFAPVLNMINFDGTLFFQGDDGSGKELWKSDGSPDGTIKIISDDPDAGPFEPDDFAVSAGALFFAAYNNTKGLELWKSGGTNANTRMVKDINPGGGSSNPGWLTDIDGALFFSADDGSKGFEPWKSYGTEQSTNRVEDINPDGVSSNPGKPAEIDGQAYFSANDGINGDELWKSDFNSIGNPTGLVFDIFPGPGGSLVDEPVSVNHTLFFIASNPTVGREVMSIGPEQVNYVALGDSYASGEGAGDYDPLTDDWGDNQCHRSKWVWSGKEPGGDQQYAIVSPPTVNILKACSGAITNDLYKVGHDWKEPPQLNEAELADAILVTLSIGGNDTGFAMILEECAAADACHLETFVPDGQPEGQTASLRAQVAANLNYLTTRLPGVYEHIKDLAPDATVAVTGYPYVMGQYFTLIEFCRQGVWSSDERLWFQELVDKLNNIIKTAAEEAGADFVPIKPGFLGHEACSGKNEYSEWINRFDVVNYKLPGTRDQEAFHPNQKGQQQYAIAVKDHLDSIGFSEERALNRTGQPSRSDSRQTGPEPPEISMPYESGILFSIADVPSCGLMNWAFEPDQEIDLSGSNFKPDSSVGLYFLGGTSFSEELGTINTSIDGSFLTKITIPADAPLDAYSFIKAVGEKEDGGSLSLYHDFMVVPSTSSDGDADGIPDVCDNCANDSGLDQTDTDRDGIGDLCDSCPNDYENDFDGDGMCADVDPCPFDPDNHVDDDNICTGPPTELKNLSTRADVGTGADIAIAGFIIKGDEDKCVVVRGRGPSMNVSGVPLLTDPNLTLYSGQTIIDSNDDWMSQANPANQIIIENLGLAPTDFREAAIHKCLPEGPFTALLRGGNGGTGVGIVEVFDVDDGSSILENISTRARVGTGPLVTIAGFIIKGDSPKKILLRGRGPTVGVPVGVIRLSNPKLRLYQLLEDNSNVLLEENDNWGQALNAAEITASGQAPGDSNEAAILMELDPGVYTGILDGVFGATGSGIIEVIDLTGN